MKKDEQTTRIYEVILPNGDVKSVHPVAGKNLDELKTIAGSRGWTVRLKEAKNGKARM